MLRARLMTAAAAITLLASPALAQTVSPAGQEPVTPLPTEAAPIPPATLDTGVTTPAASQAAETPAPVAGSTVIDTLKSQGQFTTLLTALDAAQLTETLNSQPAVSIFAPTDAAFAALPEADRTRLMDPANVNELRQLLLYHVVVADVNSDQIKGTRGGVETAARTQVQLDGTGASIKVDDATITTADIDASNGAVFIIDKVLNPAASEVASGDAEEGMDAAPMTTPAPATPAPTASPDPVATPAPDASAPAPTPPVAATDPGAQPTEDMPETPVTPPAPQ